MLSLPKTNTNIYLLVHLLGGSNSNQSFYPKLVLNHTNNLYIFKSNKKYYGNKTKLI